MSKETINVEMKENGVVDNPFDLMMYYSFELVREILFGIRRYRSIVINDDGNPSRKKINEILGSIITQIDMLDKLSDDAANLCKDSAYYCNNDQFNYLNFCILELERVMETKMTKCNPFRNLDYEKARLGKDSPEFKHLNDLIKIANESEISNYDSSKLFELMDVMTWGDECEHKFNYTKEQIKYAKELIEKYKLTEDDVNYIISYKNAISFSDLKERIAKL